MFRTAKTIMNEDRGNILAISLMLVFAASIIGTTVAMLSSTDLKIAGNQRLSTEAFFAAVMLYKGLRRGARVCSSRHLHFHIRVEPLRFRGDV